MPAHQGHDDEYKYCMASIYSMQSPRVLGSAAGETVLLGVTDGKMPGEPLLPS